MRLLLVFLFVPVGAAAFPLDRASVVGRSDIVLTKPNLLANQAMPLGNGTLGVAVWSASGLTAQLNRVDTMPGRLSPGQVMIPGLAKLTSAADYAGRLNLYDGEFIERGGGMTARAYVQPDSDSLVIDVTGADPAAEQTAVLTLWAPRTPLATANGKSGTLAQSWIDSQNPGASGRSFGTYAAVTAVGRDVRATVTGPLTITVSFRPAPDGHFRVLVAAPHYDGTQKFKNAFTQIDSNSHGEAWHAFWHRAGLITATSEDGAADYFENLRHLYLYCAQASSKGEYPGSQAGLADMFSSVQDLHKWDPSAFWHWNLRMQVAANLGAGLPELNAPYFRLYRDGLPNIEKWTREHMAGRPGICVPETMRFNGPGYEYEAGWGTTPVTALNCDAGSKPYYNARTISTGAEVALWIWQQYLMSNDRQFLAENYPVMAAAARFLLAYQEPGADGLDHTSPSNAHEQLWDTIDPTTDLAARVALYPTVIEAAKLLGRDSSLISQLSAALPRIPAIPRMRQTGTHTLLAAGQGEGEDVIAESYDPGAKAHNFENIGLELVWPYNLIGDTSNLFGLAKRTYLHRPYPTVQDWSFDPIQAARLGLGNEVESTLRALTTKYQTFVNGFANWGGTQGEFYIEQVGVVAAALEEVLVQDYDGIIRVAPAVPASWNVDGIVAVRKNTSVMAQVRNGAVASVIIKSGAAQYLRVRNPWPGETPVVVTGNQKVPVTIVQYVLTFQAKAGGTYRITRAGSEGNAVPAIKAEPARAVRHLGPVQIGL